MKKGSNPTHEKCLQSIQIGGLKLNNDIKVTLTARNLQPMTTVTQNLRPKYQARKFIYPKLLTQITQMNAFHDGLSCYSPYPWTLCPFFCVCDSRAIIINPRYGMPQIKPFSTCAQGEESNPKVKHGNTCGNDRQVLGKRAMYSALQSR